MSSNSHLSTNKSVLLPLDFVIKKRNQGINTTTEKVSYSTAGISVIRSKNIKNGVIDFKDVVYVDTVTYARLSEACKPKQGDILYTNIGDIGNSALVENNFDFLIAWNVLRVQPKDNVDRRYLKYLLGEQSIKNQMLSLNSSSTLPFISGKEFGKFEVPFPSLDYQRKIAEILTPIDDRITILRETNATLEAIAQALFKSWFVDFDPVRAKMEGRAPEGMGEATAALFSDGFEESELGSVPRGWRVGTLANLAEFQNGYAFKSKDWVDSGHPVVKIGDVKPGIIDFSGCSYVTPGTTLGLDRFRLNRGDLLVGMTGYVGETGLVAEVEPAAYLNQRVGRIATACGLKDVGLVYCLVRNAEFKAYAEAQSHGSAQANVSGSALLSYPSVIPAADVQLKFKDLIYPILETILSNHETGQTLATLRDTLLPRLISGQLRLPEAEALLEEACA